MSFILRAIATGLSIGSVLLLLLESIKQRDVLLLLGIGVSCLSVDALMRSKKR